MNDLVSMLVPGETFPGWPDVQSPSVIFWLVLLVGIPVTVLLIVSLIGMGPTLIRSARGEQVAVDESVWLGPDAQPRAVTAAATAGSAARELTPGDATASAASTGGASERW